MTSRAAPAGPAEVPALIELDGRRMRAVQTAPNGVINRDTVFEFRQQGAHVSARYAGGRVAVGHLLGLLDGDRLEFRFVQRQDGDQLAGGHSRCTVERDEAGRVRLVERFQWADGGEGVNVIAEA